MTGENSATVRAGSIAFATIAFTNPPAHAGTGRGSHRGELPRGRRGNRQGHRDAAIPLGANRTITDNPYNEYQAWPTAAAGASTVLSGAAKDTAGADLTPGGSDQAVLELLR